MCKNLCVKLQLFFAILGVKLNNICAMKIKKCERDVVAKNKEAIRGEKSVV